MKKKIFIAISIFVLIFLLLFRFEQQWERQQVNHRVGVYSVNDGELDLPRSSNEFGAREYVRIQKK